MLRSMTGFGRGEASSELFDLTVEMKAVNHRYLDVVIRLPKELNSLEEEVRRQIRQAFSRGRFDVFIRLTAAKESLPSVTCNLELARLYLAQARTLAEETGLDEALTGTAARVFLLPEVVQMTDPEFDVDQLREPLQAAVTQALESVEAMRAQEGARLAADMQSRLAVLRELLGKVEVRSPLVVEEYRQKLADRLQELLPEGLLDESRLAQEVAFFADRASITEETVRLHSHFRQFDQLLQSDSGVGRKLDFLLQEMNREVNTIGSKANDAELALLVVEMKSELEKIREQAQNIE
ncbi:MAG: YicC/YloC family endoribonuclease [Bacillota bacterium]|jgi:uncharacterized protein (TIGR00255 family)